MSDRHRANEPRGVLPLEVIDEAGQVVDTVYVGEITGHKTPPPVLVRTLGPVRRHRDE